MVGPDASPAHLHSAMQEERGPHALGSGLGHPWAPHGEGYLAPTGVALRAPHRPYEWPTFILSGYKGERLHGPSIHWVLLTTSRIPVLPLPPAGILEKRKKKKKKPGVTLDKSLWDFQVRINETNLV